MFTVDLSFESNSVIAFNSGLKSNGLLWTRRWTFEFHKILGFLEQLKNHIFSKFCQLGLSLCFLWHVLFCLISVLSTVIFVFSLFSGPSDWSIRSHARINGTLYWSVGMPIAGSNWILHKSCIVSEIWLCGRRAYFRSIRRIGRESKRSWADH
jgi:hypothetical protein